MVCFGLGSYLQRLRCVHVALWMSVMIVSGLPVHVSDGNYTDLNQYPKSHRAKFAIACISVLISPLPFSLSPFMR